ncbi:MAG: GNAT family N-acetyltransferase [Nitrososphaerota archaeon]
MGVTGSELRIRRARPEEAERLTTLIRRSKAHWGYDAALLDAWRPDLTLDRETIARDPVYCAEDTESGIVLGVSHFYGLNSEEVYLDHLFVEPASIGQGVGSALWRHAIEQARAAGARSIVFGADPHARPFYERMGAVVVDWRESSIVPGRRNPYLRFDLL